MCEYNVDVLFVLKNKHYLPVNYVSVQSVIFNCCLFVMYTHVGRSSRGHSRPRDYSLTMTSTSCQTTVCNNGASCYDCVTRGRQSAASRQKVRHTQMLVVVVVVFFICELPDFLLRVYMSVYAVLRTYDSSYELHYVNYQRPVLRYANVISNFLLTVNSCCNFVIYILIGRKFRAILVCMLLGKRRSSSVAEARF